MSESDLSDHHVSAVVMKFLCACQKTGRIMKWPCPSVCRTVFPYTIACERNSLKTACLIDFTFLYGLNTTKTSHAIDLGHSTKKQMATTAVGRLTLYPMQDIAC